MGLQNQRRLRWLAVLHALTALLCVYALHFFSYPKAVDFAAISRMGSFLCHYPAACLLPVIPTGAFLVASLFPLRKVFAAAIWIVIAGTALIASLYFKDLTLGICGTVAALPGLIGLPIWLKGIYLDGRGAKCRPWHWIELGLSISAAIILSFAVSSLFIIGQYPNFPLEGIASFYPVGRTLALVGCLSAIPFVGLLLFRWVSGYLPGRAFVLGLGLTMAVVLWIAGVLLLGLRILTPDYRAPLNLLSGLSVGFPFAIVLWGGWVHREGGFLGFERPRSTGQGIAATRGKMGHRICWDILVLVTLFVWHWGIAHLQMRYSWGISTSIFYISLAIGGSLWLLWTCSPFLRVVFSTACLAMIPVAGALIGGGVLGDGSYWRSYLLFDKNVSALHSVYHSLRPSQAVEDVQLRRFLDDSLKLATDPTLATPAEIPIRIAENVERPRFVFLVIADAVRASSYGPDDGHPGLRWIRERFAAYDNAWTSYNATAGSLPAIYNGRLHGAWFQAGTTCAHGNLIQETAERLGYRVFNFSKFMGIPAYWPGAEHVEVPVKDKVTQTGDPAPIFSRVLELLDDELLGGEDEPAFLYVHLYNNHEPLIKREGIPIPQYDFWMRSLYEQNITYLDLHLHRLLTGLEKRGILDESLIVITSDHGEELFDYGGLYHGWQINPEVMHVPLLVHYPDCHRGVDLNGTVIRSPANLLDIYPTISSVMGVETGAGGSQTGIDLSASDLPRDRDFVLLNWDAPTAGTLSFEPFDFYVRDAISGDGLVYPSPTGGILPISSQRDRPEVVSRIGSLVQKSHMVHSLGKAVDEVGTDPISATHLKHVIERAAGKE